MAGDEEPIRVSIYGRISDDDTGAALGVERQIEDGRALAELRGWAIVGEHTDNNISALRGRRRPGYEDLMAQVTAGDVDRIVVWQTSRLWRNRRERAEGIELLRQARVSVTAVRGPDLDLSTAYGRGMAGLLGEFDTLESEVKGERVERAALQRAQTGHANGAAGYGWVREYTYDDRGRRTGFRDVLDEPAAAVVRELTTRVLRMESLHAITRDLNARGVPPPGASLRFVAKNRAKGNDDGTSWGRTSVRKLVTRPANAGLRVHHRGRPDQTLYAAAWPALVPRADWEQACAILSGNAVPRPTVRPGQRKHLLTWGIAECGTCAAHLRVATKGRGRHVLYVCAERGCTGRNQTAVDDFVSRVVIARLQRPDALAWIRARDDRGIADAQHTAQLLRGRITEAATAFAAGAISIEALQTVEEQCRPALEAADRALAGAARTTPSAALTALAGPQAERAWTEASVTTRRAVLELLRVRVRILPTRPGPGFDPDSVAIDWLDA